MSLAALGVVYGDIGTSPLYAFRQALGATSPSELSVLGILSMIVWALVIVVSLKYLLLVMRADNKGEGGILALLALLHPWRGSETPGKARLIVIGVFGAALLYGDGMITPAISVLSAVEGIETIHRGIAPYVVPLTIVILLLLFLVQSRGTASVGTLFGPVTLVWFIVIAVLGLVQIVEHPVVLKALSPTYAVLFAAGHPTTAFTVLGAVFLVVTGCEALYADMGHFGRAPIRLAWFVCAFPCLVLNYLGQGALVLGDAAQAAHPFYHLAPDWFRIPLVVLATAATVIASQAVISGAFSLTRQAVQLGQFPPVLIRQTSAEETGQVYVPAVNLVLALATIGLVLGFGSSTNLAGAYGIAVSTTMVITTFLTYFVMAYRWKWSPWVVISVTVVLIAIDLNFLVANSLKIIDGGWFPLLVGGLLLFVMSTWASGRRRLNAKLMEDNGTMRDFLAELKAKPVVRVPGTAVFMTASPRRVPPSLRHQLKHIAVLHEKVILLTVVIEVVPRVSARERLEIEPLGQNFLRMRVHYGFMQSPNIPVALMLAAETGLELDLERITYILGRETVLPAENSAGLNRWRARFFGFLSRNSLPVTAHYNLPPDRVVELGVQVRV
ncbi:MAG: KUP/HAK/KT family potassium transporter [Alphaproteobacteria bacterium]|nr:KUP/HAK/KT family potassium transporter [Alphaproteobacteria bacterium]MCB9929929.1 KUP/HAK/KT family potassium transporter [Alphaproteobacteria bacterium]